MENLFAQAAQLNTLCDLGLALISTGRMADAIPVLHRAEQLAAGDHRRAAAIAGNLGTAHSVEGDFDAAEACFRRGLAAAPDWALLWNNLGNLCFRAGRVGEAIACTRRAGDLNNTHLMVASNLQYYLQYDPACDAAALRQELAAWRKQYSDPLRRPLPPLPNDRRPDRPLRIGYVSPDFRDHCQSMFMMPLLTHHDRGRFAIHLYGDVACPDAVTARLRQLCDGWHDTVGRSDEQLADMVRTDRIDVLVDLTMHMAGNRLAVFTRKPAPVQVTWLAYPGSTGLDLIDYRLSDPHLDPPGGDDTLYAEKTWRLPATFWCYDPLQESPPEPGPPPALAHGHVTFGCLNNYCKVNEGVLRLWARVLSGIPESRLVLLADNGAHREHALRILEAGGVERRRVRFEPRQARRSYLELYRQIDIGLDTFPYNGHTTSLDSYFMGVPVVTLAGTTVVGRAGVSQLMNLGLPELIARTPEEFVEIAQTLAADRPRLGHLRASLRSRMEASPLMDARAFARGMEAAFRHMWVDWCGSG